jgi:predicted phage baseplate assembly protein
MAFVPPLLDDRTWKDLRDEALARVPIYTPEWTDLRPGDPGVTLVELFAYLTEALIYRLNRVPDNSYLAFLNLLDASPLPAQPALGLLQVAPKGLTFVDVLDGVNTAAAGKVRFALGDSLRALPVELQGYLKCRTSAPAAKTDAKAFADSAFAAFKRMKGASAGDYEAVHTATQAYPPTDGSILPLSRAVDGALWLAVLARKGEEADLDAVRAVLSDGYLSIGVSPASPPTVTVTACAAPEDPGGNRAAPSVPTSRFRWEMTAPLGITGYPLALGWNQDPSYRTVRLVSDTTSSLARPGVIKLKLPAFDPASSRPEDKLATWDAIEPKAGAVPQGLAEFPRAGDLPPLLDDGDLEKRVVFWLRAVAASSTSDELATERTRVDPALSWIGASCVDITQAVAVPAERMKDLGSGAPLQQLQLAQTPVVGPIQLSVDEDGTPTPWTEVPDFNASDERSSVFVIDRALGLITVGDGLRGRVLPDGAQLTATYRYGGGLAGNLPPGAVKTLSGPAGSSLDAQKTVNPVATYGGSETETVDQARRRVPMILRHQNRAVTADDFRELTAQTPGVSVGRVEVLPLFRPGHPETQQYPGVVTVLVIPAEDARHPRAPLPDRGFREQVCTWLDRHRLITTELYVIAPRYVQIAVAIGLQPKTGFGIEKVSQWVRMALFQFLAPLPPFGPDGSGWPLGGRINRAAIEAAVLQVDGVAWVNELRLYTVAKDGSTTEVPTQLDLSSTELPELTRVEVGEGSAPAMTPPAPTGNQVPVPVPVPRTGC